MSQPISAESGGRIHDEDMNWFLGGDLGKCDRFVHHPNQALGNKTAERQFLVLM